MYTRKQYLNKEVSHEDYYSQFVTDHIKHLVETFIGQDAIIKSSDPYLNDIPLKKWDSLYLVSTNPPKINALGIGKILGESNGSGGVSMSDMVCVLKAAARMLKKEWGQNK